MDSDCPCCAPPWSFARGTGEESIYVACLEGSGSHAFILKLTESKGSSRLYPASPGGALAGATILDLCADRQSNVYFCTSEGLPKIVSLDKSGSVRWSALANTMKCLAVGLDGFLYASEVGADAIHKYDAATGTEVTAGGWPLTPSASRPMICIDKACNLYTAGPATNGGIVTAYNSSLSTLWQTTLTSTGSTTKGRIAINEPNTKLIYCHSGPLIGQLGLEIDAATGTVTTHSQSMFADDADFSPDGSPVNVTTNLTVSQVDRNWTSYYASDDPLAIACSYDDSVYASQAAGSFYGNEIVKLGAGGAVIWMYSMSGSEHAGRLAIATGRIGAFGFR